jgi:hypothetical protein
MGRSNSARQGMCGCGLRSELAKVVPCLCELCSIRSMYFGYLLLNYAHVVGENCVADGR